MSAIRSKIAPLIADAFRRQDLVSLKEWASQTPDFWQIIQEEIQCFPMVYAYRHRLLLSFVACLSSPRIPHFSYQAEMVRNESLKDGRSDCVELLECGVIKSPKTQLKALRQIHATILR